MITADEASLGASTLISDPRSTHALGADAVLVPRAPAIAEPFHALLAANHERLAAWFPGLDAPPTLEATRAGLAERGRALLDGSQLPFAIAVREPEYSGLRLVGVVDFLVDDVARSAELGYWIDPAYEGRGLVSRAARFLIDRAFGPLGLDRVWLATLATNTRSRALAEHLGFTQEGLLREAALFADGRRDEAVYGLLAREWKQAGTVA